MIDPELQIVRVDGGVACSTCGKPYREHPFDEENTAYDGTPFLHVGCDGRRLKL